MRRSKESILKDAVLKENNSLFISQLCNITGQNAKAVKQSIENIRTYAKDRAEKEGKTFEDIIEEISPKKKQ